jgi:catechol 2,3-dioxygenase-like lactoylglutathione lyase family enzyme
VAVDLFAGLFVSDYEASRSWYERLFGREPTFLATETEAVWELAEHRWLYIKQNPEHAGHGGQTVFFDDLDARVTGAGERGVEPARHEDYPGDVRKVVFRDPDGNEIGFGGGIG